MLLTLAEFQGECFDFIGYLPQNMAGALAVAELNNTVHRLA